MGVLLTLEGSSSSTLGEGSFDNPRPTTASLIHALSQLLWSRHIPGVRSTEFSVTSLAQNWTILAGVREVTNQCETRDLYRLSV